MNIRRTSGLIMSWVNVGFRMHVEDKVDLNDDRGGYVEVKTPVIEITFRRTQQYPSGSVKLLDIKAAKELKRELSDAITIFTKLGVE